MSYVLDADLTEEYVFSLVDRCGFVNVTSDPQWEGRGLYMIQDLDGGIGSYWDLSSLRTSMIQHYLIQQNG